MSTGALLLALWHWFLTDPVGQTVAVLAAIANGYRALPAPWRTALERRWPRPFGVLRALNEALPSLVGVVFAVVHQVVRGVAKADAIAAVRRSAITPIVPPPPSLSMLLLIAVVAPLALAGCPRMPAPDGCQPRAQRCSPAGVPEVCSPTQRWTPADRRCADFGAVCCEVASAYGGRTLSACAPAGSCLPPVDAGAD